MDSQEMFTEVGVCQQGLPTFCNPSIKHCVPFNSSSLCRFGFLILQNIVNYFFLEIFFQREIITHSGCFTICSLKYKTKHLSFKI